MSIPSENKLKRTFILNCQNLYSLINLIQSSNISDKLEHKHTLLDSILPLRQQISLSSHSGRSLSSQESQFLELEEAFNHRIAKSPDVTTKVSMFIFNEKKEIQHMSLQFKYKINVLWLDEQIVDENSECQLICVNELEQIYSTRCQ